MLLATSIPPRLRGEALSDGDSSCLQRRVISSWLDADCRLISLNTEAELTAHPDHKACLEDLGISVLCLSQGPSQLLPNFHAALNALANSTPDAILAITNADILFPPASILPRRLLSLRTDQALVGRRTNIPTDDSQAVSQCDIYGFDFFAFHTSSLCKILPLIPESLVFGQPWWDLYLPLALLAGGINLQAVSSDLFLHPIHSQRWSPDAWYHYGALADRIFPRLLRQHGYQDFARLWARRRRRAIHRWHGFTVLRHRLREQRRSLFRDGSLLPMHLSDVSDAINELVDAELQRSIPHVS